jgi:RNA-dependent RNA polymerase
VAHVFALTSAHQSQEPWGELDDEAAARGAVGTAVGHSCLPERTYGRVYFNAQLHESDRSFKIVLGPPEFGLPYRFSRVYGSEALIRLSVSPKTVDSKKKGAQMGGEAIKFLSGKSLKIFHKLFQAFAVKDDTVLLIDTTTAASLYDAINWHNPVYLNHHQPSAKWAARFHLGFSTTESALLIPPENVFFLDDFGMSTQAPRPCKR